MDFYIANATRQNMDFTYRIPGQGGIKSQPIPMGGQIRVSGDLNSEEIEAIIIQHRQYGLVDSAEIKNTKEFSGYCYSIGKPCSVGNVEHLMQINQAALVERGRKIREEAALSAQGMIENNLAETGLPEQLRNYETVIMEQDGKDGRSATFSEGIRVTRDETQPSGLGQGGKRGKGRR